MSSAFRIPAVLPTLIVALTLLAPSAASSATITIVNADGAGEGFNDPTPVAPVGGNPGTTRGAQRLFIFQHAAGLWGAILPSAITIRVSATFDALACDASSAVLGSAGPANVVANFPGAGFTNTWYHIALANKLGAQDFDLAGDDITARFNTTLDNGTCLGGAVWYYGIDGNEGANVELLPVLLHELGHGLGFSTLVNASTGVQLSNRADLYERFLLDNSTGLHWNAMTNNQRSASAVNTGNVVWDGPSTTARTPSFLGERPIVRVDAPAGIAGDKAFGTATFGAGLSSPGVSGTVVVVNDGIGTTSDACQPILNTGALAGHIALIDRGTCAFSDKAAAAQLAGATAVVIANNVAGAPPLLGGTDPSITIPVVSVTQVDGAAIKANLPGVTMTIGADPAFLAGADNANRVKVYTPNPIETGSSVSHWDVSASPDLLMEPFISDGLSSSVDLTRFHFDDLGWTPMISSVPAPTVTTIQPRTAPNPFALSTSIRFDLDRGASVTIDVFDLSGRLVRRLSRGWQSAGSHSITWDGTSDRGVRVAPAVYLCRLDAGDRRGMVRIVRLD